MGGFSPTPERPHGAACNQSKGENAMTQSLDIPLPEPLDEFGWDLDEIRDLIQATPLRFGEDGLPVGYESEQLFGPEAADLTGRFF
jgi:hypothetical protein